MSRIVIESIEKEYQRYKKLAENALLQVPDERISAPGLGSGMSLITTIKHLSGNFKSRWSDFLTSDGEKDWRDRDSEFIEDVLEREQLMNLWNEGWEVLEKSLAILDDTHLEKEVTIRGKPLSVIEALHRSLAHVAYHVGQLIYLAKYLSGPEWESLTIPLGGSNAYNQNPDKEK